jgi:uncharacterized membrane protein (DUF4010 family)
MNHGRRDENDHPYRAGEEIPPSLRAELLALWAVVRPFLVAAAVGVLCGYLLRSPVAAALLTIAVLALVWWWRDVHRPGQEPKL